MKLFRLQLHWQILIALILAIVYGLLFPTTYNISPEAIQSLQKAQVSNELLEQLNQHSGKEFTTLQEFQQALKTSLSPQEYEAYQYNIRQASYSNSQVNAVSWMGDLFLRSLKMLIIPLILSSLISGITNIGTGKNLGRLGLKTMGYYLLTSVLAIGTGLLFVNLFKPGIGADLNFQEKVAGLVEKQRSLRDILIEIVPDNIFRAFNESDMLSIIFFAVLFGFFVTKVDLVSREVLKKAFNAIFDVMMKITLFIIRFTPLGIFGIVAKVIADQDDLASLMSRMGIYMGTVIAALSVHFFITLPLLMKFLSKSNAWKHFRNMTTPLLTAFSTSSSGATLPLTIEAVESKSGVSNKISSFTLPLGATINMDGTALYECVAAIFIAQAYGYDLTIVQQMIIVTTALLASIGAAAIPMAGLVMISVILTAIGLPLEGIGLILAVDRILDMFRTATNVWSDSCGAVIIAKSEGEDLPV
ncbi:dicarboxylate/amino acid:cation symporter [Sunxiuqinia elliptica]|uniref:Na+/H+-dicarboxylate symporter n=1 Tax=Sunxiuqinia elliptica TaxID=655355 RepID=A0A4R6GVY4_9BACT|nr:dicarboxylate/amino acid:cation symporter [Sunxiuqinia elliptica]TDN98895.1 Na+/H+-dicarboxylate symporter [Sunxiuqinia elliptica]TDO56336.1 Na+/H+-dicarboxylate symporter [Sunxiuqinia elliptica]